MCASHFGPLVSVGLWSQPHASTPTHAVVTSSYLALSQALQEIGLPTTVGTKETIPPADCQLNGAVLNELCSVETHAEAINLDVTRCGPGTEDTCHCSLGEIFLLLHSQQAE